MLGQKWQCDSNALVTVQAAKSAHYKKYLPLNRHNFPHGDVCFLANDPCYAVITKKRSSSPPYLGEHMCI